MRRTAYLLFALLLMLNIVGAPQTRATRAIDDEPTICPVHHLSLKREKLEIVYGLVIDPCNTDDRAKAAEKHFPYANSVIYGGCVILPDSPKEQEVLYCPKCREVEKTWPCLETRDTPLVNRPVMRRVKSRTRHRRAA